MTWPFTRRARETWTDAELLAAFAAGDARAASLLTERLAPPLLRFATRLLSDPVEAEDVVQDAMIKLWHIAPDWQDGGAKVSTWLYQVARNLCIDRLRKRRGTDLEDADQVLDERPSVQEHLIEKDRYDALQMALNDLPARQRQAVILRHIEGLSNPEIAIILEIGVEAVESLTARGKRNLASALASRKGELGYE
ncbi:RNA polymerase sigma factor [Litoreibacter roseus]|uniref:RNA polymerase sigma subunit ECF family protein n=1 Tax=Litoreibacter roseus TaxID=2601869 RepID=A0A6N6JHK1_9RHOB|nr:RNA polymerase sigma factor [Litoreibacter roseus]GFE65417.1 RNA polymerase sigma subunit ECF family protein [Litoreibacter roseus]